MKKTQRVEAKRNIASYFVQTKSTVRKVAEDLGMSKSTVYTKLTEFAYMPHDDESQNELALEVKALLQSNKNERHKRGGEATRQKFMNMKNK